MRRLGFDVWYLEDSDRQVLDVETYCNTPDYVRNVEYMAGQLEAAGLKDRWMFRAPGDPVRVLDPIESQVAVARETKSLARG